MMRGPGTARLLARALSASAARNGLVVAIEEHGAMPWHSATFSGYRHALTLTATPAGALANRWLATIGTLDVPLPGALLADLSVTGAVKRRGECCVEVEALTVAYA
ncbi:hypothetical protein [Sphingomonas dokdonensis]|uniref:Uncharacterized protein n=1 Tax=Sphingomonas dokdonensis TaxID=344880 RepID=A0A245ZNX0_9SPHN|nr:hypothetical protein [Sphingomonas dokdonensis]OWK31436.1 hypothetical protein SPDO_14450 [Sphingomonas dokdonensis]